MRLSFPALMSWARSGSRGSAARRSGTSSWSPTSRSTQCAACRSTKARRSRSSCRPAALSPSRPRTHRGTAPVPAEVLAAPEADLAKGRPVKARLGRDDLVMRGFMVVIALYLVIALALPLYVMLSKSFSTFRFDLTAYEFQVSDGEGSLRSEEPTSE